MQASSNTATTALAQLTQLREQGKLSQAKALGQRTIKSGQKNAAVYREMGLITLSEGHLKEGLHWLEKALSAEPHNGQLLFDLGQAHFRFGDMPKARDFFARALSYGERHPQLLSWYAKSLFKCSQYEEGLRIADQLLMEEPDVADHHNLRGSLLNGLNRQQEAVSCFMEAISRKPADPTYHSNLGSTFFALKLHEEAIQCCDTALILDPNHANALNNKGYALKALKRLDEAREVFGKLCKQAPSSTAGWLGIATVDYEDFAYESAMTAARRVLRLDPDHLKGMAVLGGALTQTGRYDEAMLQFDRALRLDPNFNTARFGRALGLLRLGEFESGWQDHEARYLVDDLVNDRMIIDQIWANMPRWDGVTDLRGKSLLIVYEQGYGDIIQFFRLVRLLANDGVNVTLMLPKPLERLFVGQHPNIAIHASFDRIPRCDYVERMMSLPLRLNYDPLHAEQSGPYLLLKDELHLSVQERMAQLSKKPRAIRVGLVWAGRPTHANDRMRSMHLTQLQGMLEITGCEFYSLQKGGAEQQIGELGLQETIIDLNPYIEDFADSAAFMTHLDLLISVDSAPVHLAGALGMPVWTLLPFAADWRWMTEGEDTPWYSSMRLFRQTSLTQGWQPVIKSVQLMLAAIVADQQRSYS
ncbi:tetratricopeptide repeat protein [Ampullimonas aquatilis]|uniref:tetratricopeptide repeat protein n=1 Tax=Ampullimonas aquatilis TaxID=1341549 RepID=UPI003C7281F0